MNLKKKLQQLKALSTRAALAAGVVVAPVVAHAAGTAPDFTALTGSIDFSTVGAGILAVAGLLAMVYVTIKGAKIIVGFIRGS